LKGAIKTLLFLAIGAGLLWLTFRNQDFSMVIEKISHANLGWLGLSIVLSIAALISRALRWKQLIEPLGYRVRFTTAFNAMMFGYVANLAIPRIGEISKCGALSKSEDIPFEKLIGTVIVERVADVILLILCIGLVAILEFERLGGFLAEHIWNPVIEKTGSAGMLIAILGIGSAAGIFLIYKLFKMENPPASIQKIKNLMKGIGEGLATVTQLKNKWLFVFHSVFIWVVYIFMTYVCFFALPETSGLDLSAGLFMMVIGGIGMTAPVQGGIGVYHMLVSKGIELYGLNATDGIVFATMVHGTQTILLIILGGISMMALFFFTKPRPSRIDESSGKYQK